jgi:uncharacterized membrane protein HdeD (DUF308 family)
MNALTILGIVLIIAGILALVFQGISYTEKEEVVDFGPLEVQKEDRETIPLPPILGVIALVGGIALVVIGRRPAAGKTV